MRGTWCAPAALASAGLFGFVHAQDAGTIDVPAYRFDRDCESGIYNRDGVARQTRALAALLDGALDCGERALVVGGDCSVLVGVALALRRRGRCGLVFVDGHLDFRHLGNAARLSAAAGEDLAIVTGRRLPEHADVDGLAPYLRDCDVVAIGEREHDPATSDIESTRIYVVPIEEVQSRGPRTVARDTVASLSRVPDGYWIHLDVDVLDSEVMPAVDSPQPGGLRIDELIELLRELWAHDAACGLDVTVFDPELDADGKLTELLAATLRDALTAT
jgi:arginase